MYSTNRIQASNVPSFPHFNQRQNETMSFCNKTHLLAGVIHRAQMTDFAVAHRRCGQRKERGEGEGN